MFLLCSEGFDLGAILRIYLDDDCPGAGDRETAARIIQEIALNDVVTRGSFVLEGYALSDEFSVLRARI
jgi:hypothetical protein